jgi:hypothetical protein
LQDLYSQFAFLGHQPWCELRWWRRVIAEPYEKKDPRAMTTLQCVLQPLLLRRTKDMADEDGAAIVTLPPRHVHVVELALSPREEAFYKALVTRSKLQFEGAGAGEGAERARACSPQFACPKQSVGALPVTRTPPPHTHTLGACLCDCVHCVALPSLPPPPPPT